MNQVASRRMAKLAGLLLAALGVVTAAPALLDVATGLAEADVTGVLVSLGIAAALATPAVLAGMAFSRRPGLRAARWFAVLVALGYGALGLFAAWAGSATKDNFEGEAYDQWAMLQVIGFISFILAVATLLALRLAMRAIHVGAVSNGRAPVLPHGWSS
jgi:hypothetical protein